MSWKLSAIAPRATIVAALEAREAAMDWDEDIVLTAFETAPNASETWQLDAYTPRKPTDADRAALTALFTGTAPDLKAERLPDSDWVTESQRGVEPIEAGRFYVHTPDHAPSADPFHVNFRIPAAQAFGTGHHATTAGCLSMLGRMHDSGVRARNVADIGTGTGLLAFAAMALWPHARFLASDIDPVCGPAVVGNADDNAIPIGTGRGELAMLIADGMDDAAIAGRAPFDLLIANILAAPLIDMAHDFADAVSPRGHLLLAGLLERQQGAVLSAYRKAGFRLHQRVVDGDWAILWLRRRYRG